MATSFAGKTYWLVGASEGLGRSLALKLADAGARLCLSARSEDRLQALAEEIGGETVIAPLDARDSESVAAAFETLPKIDGVIYNAGVYEPTSAQEWDSDTVEAMCDVNFTGAARVMGSAIPALVAEGGGHIVIIGSLAAFGGLPDAIGYAASKAGVASLAESMRIDLPSPAYNVQLMNPGFIKTRLTDKNDFEMPHLMTPDEAADYVFKAMQGTRFRTSFPPAFAWRFRLAGLFPDWLYFRAVK
jgi:short-subunit dehydrogenase